MAELEEEEEEASRSRDHMAKKSAHVPLICDLVFMTSWRSCS